MSRENGASSSEGVPSPESPTSTAPSDGEHYTRRFNPNHHAYAGIPSTSDSPPPRTSHNPLGLRSLVLYVPRFVLRKSPSLRITLLYAFVPFLVLMSTLLVVWTPHWKSPITSLLVEDGDYPTIRPANIIVELEGPAKKWKGVGEDGRLYSPYAYEAEDYLVGKPIPTARDNLRPDLQYITAWQGGGFTNDFMTYCNLIYIALLTQRIPIIPDFPPGHQGRKSGWVPFGKVFDTHRLAASLHIPILEWRDLKNESLPTEDHQYLWDTQNDYKHEVLGCWSLWSTHGHDHGRPRESSLTLLYHLDISYTPIPKSFKQNPWEGDFHVSSLKLSTLPFPSARRAALAENSPLKSPLYELVMKPDEHMVCFDFLYWTAVIKEWEWEEDYNPVWRLIGRYAHWTDELSELANGYLRRIMGLHEDEDIPPFIAVHVRHNDFEYQCGTTPLIDCYAPISAYARRVREVQEQLEDEQEIFVEHVIMTSDEQSDDWWDDVRKQGWLYPDHKKEETVKKYGGWYTALIDAAIQSKAKGFVGTSKSTMSLVAQLRVRDWNEGVWRTVRWGRPGADDDK